MTRRVVFPTRAASVPMPGGYNVFVPFGTHWADDDPVVLQHPELFSDDPTNGMYGNPPERSEEVVEHASAAPGEKRTVQRRG